METLGQDRTTRIGYAAIAVSISFLYATVLLKLVNDWWLDENYSHGLLVPFVIAAIIWKERGALQKLNRCPQPLPGILLLFGSILLLFAGTLGAELFTQRIALVITLCGVVVYLFGRRVLSALTVPVVLLLLSIPIPQIIFNQIAFPLQILASKIAVWGVRLFGISTVRNGNVIDILPRGSSQTISLEVVGACSGIRSLMTLVTLALILGYFTKRNGEGSFANMSRADMLRTAILMIAAVPTAVLTNAARVTATGGFTYLYGQKAAEGFWHDLSGWLVYVVALAILFGANKLLFIAFKSGTSISDPADWSAVTPKKTISVWPLAIAVAMGGLGLNWFVSRGEVEPPRNSLSNMSATLGTWSRRGSDIRFDAQVESVLRASDYVMREYTNADGRLANIYVGYYASQRSGATYHSPLNCLPGAGWVMKERREITIPMENGESFAANLYVMQNGIYNEVMIYWYEGRGRRAASEYRDKVDTVWDSVFKRRSDGAIVRVMTAVGSDEAAATRSAAELSARLAEQLGPFIPE